MLKELAPGCYFDMEHYMKVYRARKKAGLPVGGKLGNIDCNDHRFVGKRVRSRKYGTEYDIKSCKKQWTDGGWYYGFILEQDNGSGTFQYLENINSINKMILRFIEEETEDLEFIGNAKNVG
jgi:hypothetical protein